jgi:putative transposase
MLRAHTIRLNPTHEQEVYFRKAAGTARIVFNWALARWMDYRAARQQISMNDLKTEFNRIKGERFPWIYDVTKCVAEREFSNLGRALANYFRMKGTGMLPKGAKPRKDGEEAGFPRFKSKHEGYASFYLANDKFRLNGHRIYIPKLGWVNMTERLRFTGKIMNATVSYRAGWWWVSIGMDIPYSPSVHQGHPVEVDVGISYLAVDSDGQVFENQKHLKAALRRVKHLQRAVSRKVKGSRNRAKAALRLAKAHFKVACKRRDAIHS